MTLAPHCVWCKCWLVTHHWHDREDTLYESTGLRLKQVLDPTGITVNRKAEKVFINREEFILHPASKAALEAANELKQAGAEIIAISVGPERMEDGLREAMARGADRAISIQSEGGDALVIANLIAAAAREIGEIDLILAGHQSLDSGAGELAPR